MSDPFFTLHRDLPREGPGSAEEVAWAAGVAGVRATARIADMACGPGGDIAALRALAPEGQVTAVEMTPHMVAAARARFADDPGVTVIEGDMARLIGPYDFIWCAGAAYFLGVTEALTIWRDVLAPGGAVAFSEPVFFTANPSEGARAMWGDHDPVTDAAGIAARVNAAGYETLATRPVSDAAWEAYYGPMEARIAALHPEADPDLTAVLDSEAEEIRLWRAHRAETGYLLSVVRPA